MKRYKLTRSPNPETHASGEVIFIKDEKRTYIRIKHWLDEHYEKKKCF